MTTLFKNGQIFTPDGDGKRAEWMVVRDGKVTEMGTGQTLQAEKEIDLNGKTILPGLGDAHIHQRPSFHF